MTNEIEVASRDEIQNGSATIICQLDNNKSKSYNIEIEKIYKNNNSDNKSMFIRITDKELLEKTGGIIQGMSGSPIIQNGKFIGAVTNVLVNDPTKGYGVFADIMIKELHSQQEMNTIFSPKQKCTVIKNATRYNFFPGTKMYRQKNKN